MKINPIPLTSFKLAAFYRFFSRFTTLVTRLGAENLKISVQFNELLAPAFKRFDEAYKKARGSKYTEIIKSLEKLIDNATSSVIGIINIMLKSSDPAKSAAARELKYLFKQNKGITRKPRAEQIADTANMIKDLKGKYSAAVATLGLGDLVEEIEKLNTEMDTYDDSKLEESAEKDKNNSAKAKKDVIDAYRAIVKLVEVLMMTDGSVIYQEFVLNLNALIVDSIRNTPSQDENSDKKEDEKEETPTVPEKPVEENKYPDAKEWHSEVRISESEAGNIFYIMVEEKKVYYKLLDRYMVSKMPGSSGTEAIWEKLS